MSSEKIEDSIQEYTRIQDPPGADRYPQNYYPPARPGGRDDDGAPLEIFVSFYGERADESGKRKSSSKTNENDRQFYLNFHL